MTGRSGVHEWESRGKMMDSEYEEEVSGCGRSDGVGVGG